MRWRARVEAGVRLARLAAARGRVSSGWSEGNFRLATGPGARIGLINATGRGAWLRAEADSIELVVVHDAKLERENSDDLGTHLPATPAWNARGEWMGVAPSRSKTGVT